jgi:signal transduction histidine kinase
MRLHKAIEQVLIGLQKPMSAQAIANAINKDKLYQRADNREVTPNQILIRARNYNNIFEINNDLIFLLGHNKISLIEEQIKYSLSELHKFSSNHLKNSGITTSLTGFYGEIIFNTFESLPKTKDRLNTEVVLPKVDPISIIKGLIQSELVKITEKGENVFNINEINSLTEIIYKLHDAFQKHPKSETVIILVLNYFIESNKNYEEISVDKLLDSIIEKWDVFKHGSHIMSLSYKIPLYEISIAQKNKSKQLYRSYYNIFNNEIPSDEINDIGTLYQKAIKLPPYSNLEDLGPNNKYRTHKIGIFIPPWDFKNTKKEWPTNFSPLEIISNSISSAKKNNFSKILLVCSVEALKSKLKNDIRARKSILEMKHTKSICSIPKNSKHNIKSQLLMLFDFDKSYDIINFADFMGKSGTFNTNQVSDFLNGGLYEEGNYNTISVEKIQTSKYSILNPEHYCSGQSITAINNDVRPELKDIVVSEIFPRDIDFNISNIEEYKANKLLENYNSIIKHTVRQPLSALALNFDNLKRHIIELGKKEVLDLNKSIYKPLEGQDINTFKNININDLITRITNNIERTGNYLDRAKELVDIENSIPKKQNVCLIKLLENISKNYPNIKFDIQGKHYNVYIVKSWWEILIDNLIENAKRHGFKDQKDQMIKFNVSKEIITKNKHNIILEYQNNGLPADENFTLDRFSTQGVKSNKSIGDGYGGYIISSITRKHDGEIEIIPENELKYSEYNFQLNFKIPLNNEKK